MQTTLRNTLHLVGAAGLTLGSACFTYVPVTAGTTPAGAEVRVRLSSEGSTQLAQAVGARVVSLDGKLSSSPRDSSMVIAAAWLQTDNGVRERWTGAPTITFPRSHVTSVQQRAVDRRKTTIAAIAVAASMVTIGTIVMRGGASEGGRDPGGGTGVFRR